MLVTKNVYDQDKKLSPTSFFSNSEKVCLKINGQDICSNDDNQSNDFQITDDTIKFNGVLDGVSSFEMVVDNENGGIQMSNVIVLHTGILMKKISSLEALFDVKDC